MFKIQTLHVARDADVFPVATVGYVPAVVNALRYRTLRSVTLQSVNPDRSVLRTRTVPVAVKHTQSTAKKQGKVLLATDGIFSLQSFSVGSSFDCAFFLGFNTKE